MKIINLILIAFIAISIISCEENMGTVDLPYSELIVIRGELIAGNPISGIIITKTLPPLDNYELDKALIPSAKAYIEYNSTKYPLIYDESIRTYYCNDIIPHVGEKYKIVVQWQGHTASAITTIPAPIDSVDDIKLEIINITEDYYSYQQLIVKGRVKSSHNVVIYSCIDNFHSYWSNSYVRKLKSGFDGQLLLFTEDYYYSNQLPDKLIVGTFDLDFYDYYYTKDNGNQVDDAFSINAEIIKWNINGDGIGMFIGSNRKTISLSN